SPPGEGEWSSDGKIRLMVAVVWRYDAREGKGGSATGRQFYPASVFLVESCFNGYWSFLLFNFLFFLFNLSP
ncbi:MAG TPA: hypothetical protein VGJ73_09335, partial [Verrucomicrobiae bacterium]